MLRAEPTTTTAYEVRPATGADLPAWHAHQRASLADNGVGGPYFAPIAPEHAEARFTPDRLEGARVRLSLGLDQPDWLRVFLLLADGEVIGHADLAGGRIPAELHRTTVGLGLARAHHRRGLGTRLMRAAIDWARGAGLAWMDLGVFHGNEPAIALYRKLGFVEVGRSPDRFRVGEASLTDISMTLQLGAR